MKKNKTLFISIAVIMASILITLLIFITEPTAEREGATIKTAMLVNVVQVNRGDYTPTIVATGTVEASKDIILSPQVSGEVIRISENFIPGSFVKKGEVLLQINPADYQNTLRLRQSDLKLAKADLNIEMGRQDVARKDYELIGEQLSTENRDLVLRKPQLEAAKATVEAAEAAVNQAQINLQRATIRAPFDAHIISRNTNIGSQLSPGAEIGRLVGLDEYWIVANVPTSKINYLSFGEEDAKSGSEVRIRSNNWPAGQYRSGYLFRLVGALDSQTRLARVLVAVPDPLVRNSQTDTIPPLMIGTFVETYINGRQLQDVIRLNRDYLRQGKTVWVMEDGKLNIRPVTIEFQDAEYAYIISGLSDNDQVVTTDLSTVVEGSALRTESNEPVQQETGEN